MNQGRAALASLRLSAVAAGLVADDAAAAGGGGQDVARGTVEYGPSFHPRTTGDAKWRRRAAGSDSPSLVTAVQEQLGLKLEPSRGPVEVLVIDRISRPAVD